MTQPKSRCFSSIPLSIGDFDGDAVEGEDHAAVDADSKEKESSTARTTTQSHDDDAAGFRTMHNMAVNFDMTGKFEQAEALYKECMKQRNDLLGPIHDDTLTSVSHLAAFFYKLGRLSEAEPLFERLTNACKIKLGPTHHKTLGSVNNLAFLNYSQGNIDKAESLFRNCLQEVAYNPHRLLAMRNLGSMLALHQRYDEAEPIYRECLECASQLLGEDHPETKVATSNLALLYRKQNNVEKAVPLYERVLQQATTLQHDSTKSSKNKDLLSRLGPMGNLAALYSEIGRYEEAERLFLELLPQLSATLGKNHSNTLQALLDLGLVYYKQAKYGDAESLYLECMERISSTVDDESSSKEHPSSLQVQERWMDMHYHRFAVMKTKTTTSASSTA